MKKFITNTLLFILMTTLCVGLIGCDFVNDILGNAETTQTDGTTDGPLPPTDNTTPSNTEPTDTNPTDTDQDDSIPDDTIIDIPLVTLESKDAYTKFLNSVKLPNDFVSHDKIDAIGDFATLVFLSNDGLWYVYSLVDSEGYKCALYVDHRDEVLSTESSVSNVTNANMRLLSDESKGSYVSDSIVYKYISGKLFTISWKEQNITYTLMGNSLLYDYPLTDSTFIGKMLNTETAPQALNDVFNTSTQDPLT